MKSKWTRNVALVMTVCAWLIYLMLAWAYFQTDLWKLEYKSEQRKARNSTLR